MLNMKNCKYLFLTAALLLGLSSCEKASIKGHFECAPASGEIVVKTQEGILLKTIDTIKVKSDGSFKYTLDVKKGQPDFFYLYSGDTKLSSLLLSAGDKVRVECDTLGAWTVEGSEDCSLLRQDELDYAAFANAEYITGKEYVKYYRKETKFVLENCHSLVVVPAIFRTIGDVPVFSQLTDAILFSQVADSLEAVYPDSKYIAQIRKEAEARFNQSKLEQMLAAAKDAPYVDVDFNGLDGEKKILSETVAASKATLLVFWDATEPLNKAYNLEVLIPLYKQFKGKGLEIYAVNLSSDKATWALVCREQKLGWVNVCDPLGRSINAYGVREIPSAFLIGKDGLSRLGDVSLAGLTAKLNAAL